ncbi:MAG: GNAT family N-acetyltransferase [Saprospiraceae bacterium]|nr:GNAT family N-acetyltransferase [Saprospiraceae bacterium]
MAKKPILRTTRLLLRQVAETDATLLFDLWNRPEVRRYLWDDQVVEMETIQELLILNDRLHREQQYGLWLIHKVWNPTELLGFCGLWHYFGEDQPQLIYGLKGDYWKQGIATEASQRIVDYAFRKLKFPFLHAATDLPNTASAKVLKRLGFEYWKAEEIDGFPLVFFKKLPNTPGFKKAT